MLGGINNFQYASNPVNWIDPLGLMAKPEDCPKKAYDLDGLKDQSPIDIPPNAKPIEQYKEGGYHQVKYKWSEDVSGRKQTYEARWHEPTPNVPEGTKPNWRVSKTLSGTPDGKFRKEMYEMVKDKNNPGKADWATAKEFRDASNAWRQGTATDEQKDLLARGHFE